MDERRAISCLARSFSLSHCRMCPCLACTSLSKRYCNHGSSFFGSAITAKTASCCFRNYSRTDLLFSVRTSRTSSGGVDLARQHAETPARKSAGLKEILIEVAGRFFPVSLTFSLLLLRRRQASSALTISGQDGFGGMCGIDGYSVCILHLPALECVNRFISCPQF